MPSELYLSCTGWPAIARHVLQGQSLLVFACLLVKHPACLPVCVSVCQSVYLSISLLVCRSNCITKSVPYTAPFLRVDKLMVAIIIPGSRRRCGTPPRLRPNLSVCGFLSNLSDPFVTCRDSTRS